MNFPDTPPDPAASMCWFLGDFHLLLPHPRPAKAAQLPWSPFPAEFPAVQSSHSTGNHHPGGRKSTYSKQVPEGHRGSLVPPATPQECRATSCAGKSGQQISGSELERRKRGRNAKYSTEFLLLVALRALICDESYGSMGWSSTGLLKQMQEHISC